MADPQTADQGFLAGLLGKFGADPAAAYGGLLSDPATQRQFALRSLGAAAQAFGQGAMPVPYKGGIPFGATLGAAGGAASTAGDELIKARLEQAQADLAQQQGLLAHANVQGLAMNNSLYPVALGLDGKGGTGAGTDGKPLTGPAKILAGGGGSTVGGIGGPENAEIRTNNFAGMRVPGAAAGGPNTNPAGWQTFATPADGVQAIGNQLDRYAAGKTTGQPLTTLRQMVSTWAPPSENDTDALIKRASTVTGLDPDAPVDLSNPAVRAKVTEAFIRNEQGGNLHPKAVEGLSAVYGNAWSPHGGQAQTAAAPAPAAEPPMAPSAAPPGGLLKLPDPTSAAPPHLATPPAAGAPGPVTGLLGQQPTQQVAAADAPQLSPAAAAILQGINRQQAGGGLLASGSVAGDNAVPTGGPSPAAVAQAGPPHTGAAGAAELAGLLAQQPAPAGPPTATPYTNAPPVTGVGAPAPAPAPAGPMPPAPGGAAPPGVAPPIPPMPPQPVAPVAAPGPIAGAPTDRQVAAASIIAHNNIMMGKAVPPDIAAILNYKYAGPTAAATAAATAPITQANAAYEARVKAQYEDWVNQNKPREIRAGGVSVEPGTNRVIQNPAIVQTTNPTDGSEHSWYSYPSLTPGGIPTYQYIGMSKPGPGATSKLTETGRIQAGQEPQPAPQQPAPPLGTPPKPTYQGYQLAPGMMSKEPDYQEPQLNKTQIDAGYAAENWPKTTRELTSSIGAAQSAEQRLTTMATAFQQVGTGAFMSDKAAWNNTLDGVFGPGGGPAWLRTSTDAGAVMTSMHEAMRATLSNLKATNPRFANAEFQGLSKMSENPDLPISANLNMLAEDIGQLRQQQGLANGWIEARANGKQDPDIFQTKWLAENKLPPIVESVKKEIGIGKMAPSGSQQQGSQSTPAQPLRAKEGDTVLGPDGSEYVIHNGVPIHKQTLQPYQSPGGR